MRRLKYGNLILACLLTLITYLQFNDPDPVYWVTVYGAAAVLAFLRSANIKSPLWTAIVIGACLAGMLNALPYVVDYAVSGQPMSIFGDMRGPAFVEPTREFFGLALILAVLMPYLKD